MEWLTFKTHLSSLTLAKDALHIYAAVAIQFAAAIVARRSIGSIVPWCAVLVLELINEGLDLLLEPELYIHQWQVEGSVHDILNTMALPTLLLLLVRHVPELFTREGAAAEKEVAGGQEGDPD